ncbi:MAG: outer membrane protein assembly factor, partial [Acidobacteriota bacterium]
MTRGFRYFAATPSRFRPAPFRKRVWEADFKEVRTLLRRKGFHRAKVSGDIRRREDGPGIVDLVVLVEEGPRAIIESVDVDGSQQVPSTEVLAHANLKPGAYFDASAVVAARERLVNLYRNRGFHEAVVDARTELDPTETRAAVSFRIWEGRQTVVDQVILAGLEVTREDTVRREVTLASRAPLSAEALLETRQRLIGTGLFSDVNIEPLPTNPFTASSNVLITLEEAPRTSFGYGFGYNERELARVEAELTRRNLFGLNRTASLFSRVSLRGSRFITTYRQPRTFGRDTPLVATTFREDQDRPTFDFVGWGVGLQLSKKISESETLFFRYNFEKTRVFQLEVERRDLPRRFREIDLRLSTVSISGVTDTRDDPVDPSQGQFRIVDFEYAPAFLGSRSPYVKGLARQFWYFPLPRRMVAVLGVRVGVAQSLQEDIDTVIPITKRFFAGGASTLRGFGLDLASPRRNLPGPDGLFRTEDDIKGEPVGGNVLTLVNLELRFPIAGKLGGVVFSDNGTVYRRLQVIQLLNWRYNLGLGFR